MRCSGFVRALEDYLASHPDAVQVNGQLGAHAVGCPRCQQRLELALRSRVVLSALRTPPAEGVDPYFLTRLQARIEGERRRRSGTPFRRPLAWRDLAVATMLLVVSLTSFVYDVHRTEAPNVDEAMVLDVPHVNFRHPSLDHRHVTTSDVLMSLLNP